MLAVMSKAVALLLMVAGGSPAQAYYENNPPYLFKDGPFLHAQVKPLADKEIPVLIKVEQKAEVSPEVYPLDIDSNGTLDYVVFTHPGKSRLKNNVFIYLTRKKGGLRKISFMKDAGGGIEDVVDINKDGKWEIILTDQFGSMKQNYLSYSVYVVRNYRLVNVDGRFKGFPKFVWFTKRDNDKDTMHLSADARQRHVQKKNKKIIYEDIK